MLQSLVGLDLVEFRAGSADTALALLTDGHQARACGEEHVIRGTGGGEAISLGGWGGGAGVV